MQLLEGAAEALRELQGLGYKMVVVSNQSGVARGIVTEEMLEKIHERLRELLAAKGATLDKIYYCPYHPDGVIDQYRKDSDWRKPKPGMLLAAAQEMDIDLAKSWMIGDTDRDMEAGRSAGCRTILISTTRSEHGYPEKSRPDHVAVNMREAVNIVKKYHRSVQESRTMPASPTNHEETLAAKSAEILSMVEEYAAQDAERQKPASLGQADRIQRAGPSSSSPASWSSCGGCRRPRCSPPSSPCCGCSPGIVQVFVPFCLLLALWFLMGTNRQDNNVFVALGLRAPCCR